MEFKICPNCGSKQPVYLWKCKNCGEPLPVDTAVREMITTTNKPIEFKSSSTFLFEDEKWIQKVLIGTIIFVIPIVNLIFFGYILQLMRNVYLERSNPLPEWDDLGQKFLWGLGFFGASMIYSLISSLPFLIVIFSSSGSARDSSGNPLNTLLICGLFIIGLIYYAIFPAMLLMFAKYKQFGSYFQINEIFQLIFRDLRGYYSAYISTWIVGIFTVIPLCIVFQLLGSSLIGLIISGFILTIMQVWYLITFSHAFGQYAAMQRRNGFF